MTLLKKKYLISFCFLLFFQSVSGLFYFPVFAKTDKNKNIIIDKSGRKIVFSSPFKRIISLYSAHTENLISIGAANSIIGVNSHDICFGKIKNKTLFSFRDDPEKFLWVKPDLVLIRPLIDRGYGKLIKKLEQNNIIVISLQPNNIKDICQYWLDLGSISGHSLSAKKNIHMFKDTLKIFHSLTSNITRKKRVYFESMHSKMKTFSKNSIAMFVLKTAGGINIAEDAVQVRKTNIAYCGKERLLLKASEIDVYLAQFGSMNQPTISIIKNETGYSIIKAVQNNKIYLISEQIVSRPTLRLLQGIYQTGNFLYPDIFNKKIKKELTDKNIFLF